MTGGRSSSVLLLGRTSRPGAIDYSASAFGSVALCGAGRVRELRVRVGLGRAGVKPSCGASCGAGWLESTVDAVDRSSARAVVAVDEFDVVGVEEPLQFALCRRRHGVDLDAGNGSLQKVTHDLRGWFVVSVVAEATAPERSGPGFSEDRGGSRVEGSEYRSCGLRDVDVED